MAHSRLPRWIQHLISCRDSQKSLTDLILNLNLESVIDQNEIRLDRQSGLLRTIIYDKMARTVNAPEVKTTLLGFNQLELRTTRAITINSSRLDEIINSDLGHASRR
jgi:hypothetical protein